MKIFEPVDLDESSATDSDVTKHFINPEDGLNHKVRTIRGRPRRPLALEQDERGPGRPTWLKASVVSRAIVSNIVSVSSIFMGVIYLGPKGCPSQPLLAPVLLLSGILGLMLSVLDGCCWDPPEFHEDEDPQRCFGCRFLTAMLSLIKIGIFLFLCFIVILLWVKYEAGACEPNLLYYSMAQICIVVLFMVAYSLHQICAAVFKAGE